MDPCPARARSAVTEPAIDSHAPSTGPHPPPDGSRRRLRRTSVALLVPLLTLGISVLVLPERPANTARLDEAKLALAAALAEHDEARTSWHASRQTGQSHSGTNRTTTVGALIHNREDELGRRTTVAAEQASRLERATRRLHDHAEQASQGELLLEQLRTLVHPPVSHPDPPLQWPVDGAVVSGYGLRAWPDFGVVHPGIDIVNVPGTPIRAAADGVVVAARKDPVQGNAVVIEHGPQGAHPGTWRTVYGHLDDITVMERERVRAGDVIATLGNTGEQTTGPHLHFEVRIEGQPVDPRRWLP